MGTLLLTILGDIVAGVAVYGITEGFSKSGGNQTVIIQNAYFNSPNVSYSSRSSSNSSSDDVWGWVMIALFIFAMIVTALVGLSAFYVQHINVILGISYWITIGMAVVGGILLTIGVLQGINDKDWSVAQITFYSLLLCAAIGGLVWLIYAQPNAPEGFEEVFVTLQNLNLDDDSWKSKAIEIGLSEGLTVNPIITYLALQAFGILPMIGTIILGIYLQGKLAWAIINKEQGTFSFYALIGAPICATIAALCLGVFG